MPVICACHFQLLLLARTYTANAFQDTLGLRTPCPKGTLSSSPHNKMCSICVRSLTTKYEGSIHEGDCAFCSKNQFRVFGNLGEYQCEQCDVCSTRREDVHMLSTCHKCQIKISNLTIGSLKTACFRKWAIVTHISKPMMLSNRVP